MLQGEFSPLCVHMNALHKLVPACSPPSDAHTATNSKSPIQCQHTCLHCFVVPLGRLALSGQLLWTHPQPSRCQFCMHGDLTAWFWVISKWSFVVDAVGMAEASAC